LLRIPDPPSAFVFGSAALMPGALRGFRQAGLDIPGSMSLVGFGDPSWYAQWGDGITTIGIPLQELAEAAASQLMRQLQPEGQANEKAPAHIALEPFFLLRGTTAPWKKATAGKAKYRSARTGTRGGTATATS
jgi:LacI family transcriptional regulator